jgi:putative transposase
VHLVVVPTATNGHGSALPSILIAIKKPVATIALATWRQRRWTGLTKLTDTRGKLHFWQSGGGFDRNVRDLAELSREVVYVHQNPVTRGLVNKSIEWAWSSARSYAAWPDQPLKHDSIIVDHIEFPGPHAQRWLGDVT